MSVPDDPLDLSGPLRLAVLGIAAIADNLALWEGYPAVFTKRPIPEGAIYPFCVINPAAGIGYGSDFLTRQNPNVRRDLIFYGEQPRDYRAIENMAFAARRFFHQNRFAFDPGATLRLVDCMAGGPVPAPVADDERHVARAVTLAIQLTDLST